LNGSRDVACNVSAVAYNVSTWGGGDDRKIMERYQNKNRIKSARLKEYMPLHLAQKRDTLP
jgi:hypothetical protein